MHVSVFEFAVTHIRQDEILHTMPSTLRRAKEQALVRYKGNLLIKVHTKTFHENLIKYFFIYYTPI